MHEIQRNLIYEIKKQSSKRSDPFYNPNSQQDDIRAENHRLRTKIRSQDTQIIRLNAKIDDLTQKILISSINSRAEQMHSMNQTLDKLSSLPMLLENKQLKQNNQNLHQQLLRINGKNNQLEAQIRQIKSQKYELQLRIKQFNILEKMREERFKDEVDRLTPIIIEEPSEYTAIKKAIQYLTKFMRQRVVDVAENIFLISVKECDKNKKINSFIIFTNYWKQINSNKTYGYAAVVSAYTSLGKVMKMVNQNYGDMNYDLEDLKDSIDQWVVSSIIQIKAGTYQQVERKLFRLLGLKYRCKFPIKGQKYQVSDQIKSQLQHAICQQISKMLIPCKKQLIENKKEDDQLSNISK